MKCILFRMKKEKRRKLWRGMVCFVEVTTIKALLCSLRPRSRLCLKQLILWCRYIHSILKTRNLLLQFFFFCYDYFFGFCQQILFTNNLEKIVINCNCSRKLSFSFQFLIKQISRPCLHIAKIGNSFCSVCHLKSLVRRPKS